MLRPLFVGMCGWIAVAAASTPATQSPACMLTPGITYNSSIFGRLPASSAQHCCTMCDRFISCAAFTWNAQDNGTCWFQSDLGPATLDTTAVSGVSSSRKPHWHVQHRIRAGEIPARAVNLGSWLVIESWMLSRAEMWQFVNISDVGSQGEFATMKALQTSIGREAAIAMFERHRAAWITEQDLREIAAAGINMVRVPVGFWIVQDDPAIPANDIASVFAPGSLKYLDELINEWAVKYDIAVMVSLHAHQGSQNGWDHSAPQEPGQARWSTDPANVANSLQLATYLAARYKDSAAFLGMNLMNEPFGAVDLAVVKAYYKEAYRRIRGTINDCVLAVSPLIPQQRPPFMQDWMRSPDFFNVWHEWHPYFKWGYEGQSAAQILDAAAHYRERLLDPWRGNPIFLGEWSLGHPDEAWYANRTFLTALADRELEQFQGAQAGWAFWSWHNDNETGNYGTWSLRHLLQEGIIRAPIA